MEVVAVMRSRFVSTLTAGLAREELQSERVDPPVRELMLALDELGATLTPMHEKFFMVSGSELDAERVASALRKLDAVEDAYTAPEPECP